MARLFSGGSSQYLSRNAAIISGYPFTMACWAQVTSATTAQNFMAVQTTSGSARHTLSIDISSKLVVASRGSTLVSHASTNNMAANTWHHCVGVWINDTTRRSYLDSSLTNSTAISAGAVAGLGQFMIGARRDAAALGNYLTGYIAEAGIWSVELNQAEVDALRSGIEPIHIRPESLLAYWPLGGFWGNLDTDFATYVHSLTAVNGPTYGGASTNRVSHSPTNYLQQYNFWNATTAPAVTKTWIKVGGVWKQGTPWVKQMGTWRQGSPKIKIGGSWK